MKIVLLVLLSLFSVSTMAASINKCIQPDGRVVYQKDICGKSAKVQELKVDEINPDDVAEARRILQGRIANQAQLDAKQAKLDLEGGKSSGSDQKNNALQSQRDRVEDKIDTVHEIFARDINIKDKPIDYSNNRIYESSTNQKPLGQ